MLPWPIILGMLASLQAYNGILTATAVQTAASVAAGTGAVAGAAGAAAASNPRTAVWLLQQPLRLLNAPFYYLLGGAEASRRLRTLELANSTLAEAQNNFISDISGKKLVFDALKVCLSEEYIEAIKNELSTNGGSLNLTNPATPSLCSIAKFVDPFNEQYTVIVLNELGDKLLVIVCVSAVIGSGLVLLIYMFRRIIRYGLKGYKIAKKIVLEEKQQQSKSTPYEEGSSKNPSTNFLTS